MYCGAGRFFPVSFCRVREPCRLNTLSVISEVIEERILFAKIEKHESDVWLFLPDVYSTAMLTPSIFMKVVLGFAYTYNDDFGLLPNMGKILVGIAIGKWLYDGMPILGSNPTPSMMALVSSPFISAYVSSSLK